MGRFDCAQSKPLPSKPLAKSQNKEGEFMPSKSFRFSGVLGFGWNVMKSNFWFFVGVSVVLFLIPFLGQIAGGLIMALYPRAITPFWFLVLFGVILVIEVILIIGLIRITLIFCDGRKPGFGTLFSGWDCFWRFLFTGIFYILILNGTSIACILPFALLSDAMRNPLFAIPILVVICILVVMLAIKFSLCFYFVVDKGLGPINALKASSMATTGAKGSLFVFFILCGLINLLGELCFFVGVFATFPTVIVATALVYRHLSEQTPELAELGISSPNVRSGSIAGGILNTSGIRLDPAIQAVVTARPDQNIRSREVSRPAGGIQPAAQSGTGVRLSQGVQLNPVVQSNPSVQPTQSVRPASIIQSEGKKKRDDSLIFWLTALVVVSVAVAAGIVYRLWPRSKSKIEVSMNEVSASSNEIVVTPKENMRVMANPDELALTGILYSEDKPLAIIDGKIVKEGDIIHGVKVANIYKNEVEFEKNGMKWTQRMK
jgi:hypothetical protein